MSADRFKTKDLSLITYLRFRGFRHEDTPEEDKQGTRWVVFPKSELLEKEVMEFMSGGTFEARLLEEYRQSRRFLLDTESVKK
jgi:hypothetical protein